MLTKSKNFNENYALKIVEVKNLQKHPNADRLMLFYIDGNTIITSNQTQEGDIVVYFPLLTQINSEYLSKNNEYRDKTLNLDQEAKTGFFDKKGVVKPTKLRDVKSEGYISPISSLEPIIGGLWRELALHIGEEFDTVEGFILAQKYVVPRQQSSAGSGEKKSKTKKWESKLIENQFRFHDDTPQLLKNIWKLKPNTEITVTKKLHGTSFVSSNILCKRPLKWYEKVLKRFGVRLQDNEYDNVYSSRKVIKNEILNPNANHYYKTDIWGEANDLVKEGLLAGETVYGEIVGYTKDGGFIQGPYDYGCKPGEFKIYIYRITYTNPKGNVFELSYQQMSDRCRQLGIAPVPLLYKGAAIDLYSGSNIFSSNAEDSELILEKWRGEFVQNLRDLWVHDQDCDMCLNQVPAEGVCLRIEGLKPETYKFKNFRFLGMEAEQIDKNINNIEDEQAI